MKDVEPLIGEWLDMDDLAGARRGLERAAWAGLQPGLHRRDLGRPQNDRGPLGARDGGGR
jgi:hypothetical protein